jgi:hypothetical protein
VNFLSFVRPKTGGQEAVAAAAAAALRRPARRSLALRRRWPALLLALYLLASTVYVGARGVGLMDELFRFPGNDFVAFYAAAEVVTSEDRAYLYHTGAPPPGVSIDRRAVGNYFNPPGLALLVWPLTLLPLYAAKSVLTALSVAAAIGLVLLSKRWARSRADVWAAALATASFWPLWTALHLGQPSAIFALVAAASVAALLDSRVQLAGWTAALLVLKPSIGAAHMAFVFIIGDRRTLVPLVAGGLVFGLLPFVLLGGGALREYLDLLSRSREDAFRLVGQVTAGASLMFNWNGFIGRLLIRDPNAAAVLALDAVTLALTLKVWSKGNVAESWLAAALATNLAVPHLVYYDTLLLLAPSFAVGMARRDPVTVGLLLLTHFAVNVSMYQVYWGGWSIGHRDGGMFIAATPAMFLLLCLLAFDGAHAWLLARIWHRAPAVPAQETAA